MNEMQFTGIVQVNQKYARQLGFPTANIIIDSEDPHIKMGVYLSMATIYKPGKSKHAIFLPSISYIPPSLTVLETHFLDFSENIYDQKIGVKLIKFIRGYRVFKTEKSLIDQIKQDVLEAKAYHFQKEGI